MENQMEKKMENEMETLGPLKGSVGIFSQLWRIKWTRKWKMNGSRDYIGVI